MAELALILDAVMWPLLLFLVVLIFRKVLRDLIERLSRIRFTGGSVEFGHSGADQETTPRFPQPPGLGEEGPFWKNIDNVFWLGHDLMLTIDTVLRNGPRARIIYGTNHALMHLHRVGLRQTEWDTRLSHFNKKAESSNDYDWTRDYRDSFATDLRDFIGDLGDFVGRQAESLRAEASCGS